MAGHKRARPRAAYIASAIVLLAAVLALGSLLNQWMTDPGRAAEARLQPRAEDPDTLQPLFDAAVTSMQQGRHGDALRLWHRALQLDSEVPEVQVNMGFTLIELGKPELAENFFRNAIDLDPFQANAYYGLALCHESAGDLAAATGAMRSYIHLARGDGIEPHLRRARAALWEWEAELDAEAGDE